MADSDKIKTRYHYEFINNVIGSFFKDSLDYFSSYLYPRFQYSLMSTYDKAVVYFNNKQNLGREVDKPNLPAIIMNPSGELGLSDTGKQLYRFPNLAPGLIKRIYDPIYQDENVLVTVGFTRLKGDFELLILTNSFYQYCDLRLLFIQIFGGTERIIYPRYFNSFIILPNELVSYKYDNEYSKKTYTLDWEKAGAKQSLIRSTDTTEWTFPCTIRPWYRLISMGDASNKYGGVDDLADWRLTIGIEYEVEIPSYIILQSDYLAKKMNLTTQYFSVYSEYLSHQPSKYKDITKSTYNFGLLEDSPSTISDGTTVVEITEKLKFKNRYYHTVTKDEIEFGVVITLPEKILDLDLLYVNSVYGELKYGDYYILGTDGKTITFTNNVKFSVGDYIEFYIYEKL